MAVIPLVPKTKMVDVDKLISLENLLVTTTTARLILSRAFGADYMTRIAYMYSRLPRTLSLSHTLSLYLSICLSSFRLPETAWPCQLVRHYSICVTSGLIHSATFFFTVLPFRLDLFQSRAWPQTFHQIVKETNNEHGRRHVPPRIHCYISVYWYLAWNT